MSTISTMPLRLHALRAAGWTVACHNDYRQHGWAHTFWLLTHPSGVWAKGEGQTDESALIKAEIMANARLAWAKAHGPLPEGICTHPSRTKIGADSMESHHIQYRCNDCREEFWS